MPAKTPRPETRNFEQILEHYQVEKELAGKLMNSTAVERSQLYSLLYRELFRRVPHHPGLTNKLDEVKAKAKLKYQFSFLRRFLREDTVFLEVGPGDCRLALKVASVVRSVMAVDVVNEQAMIDHPPPNFRLLLSDGRRIPAAGNSVSLAYSNQVMEHLHPDDALEQLRNIFRVLRPGGKYVCVTPNRLSGPHDISKYFDESATCFHLKEYTVAELSMLLRRSGFSNITVYIGNSRTAFIPVPAVWAGLSEKILASVFPSSFVKRIVRSAPGRLLLNSNIKIVGTKSGA